MGMADNDIYSTEMMKMNWQLKLMELADERGK
jgi:hypothetical protein